MSTAPERTTTLGALTPGTWTIDPAHTEIGFVARHLMVSKVRGRFADFSGTVEVADDITDLERLGHRPDGLDRLPLRGPRHPPAQRRLLRRRELPRR